MAGVGLIAQAIRQSSSAKHRISLAAIEAAAVVSDYRNDLPQNRPVLIRRGISAVELV